MNRIIKFRAWDSESKKMIYVKDNRYLRLYDDGSGAIVFVGPGNEEDELDVTIENLMQFTGLLDKNGNEIYEGDIVDCDRTKYICKWNVHRCEFAWYSLDSSYIYPIGDCRTYLEIIGNLYQTPELVTQSP